MSRAEWADFYEGMADILKGYSPEDLYQKVLDLHERKALAGHGEDFLGYMHFGDSRLWQERGHKLDPFTVIGIFNRGQTDAHRERIGNVLAKTFGLKMAAPACYHGIPHLDPRKSIYDGDSQMWALFNASLSGPQAVGFAAAYDAAKDIKGNGLGTLSIGLFWIRPYKFMALDRISDPYISAICQLAAPAEKCSGAEYAGFMEKLASALAAKKLTYPEIAYSAWREAHPGESC